MSKKSLDELLLEKVTEKISEDPGAEQTQDAMPTEAEMADNAEMENEVPPEEMVEEPMNPIDFIKVDKSIESLTVSDKHKRLKILDNFRDLLEQTNKLYTIIKGILADEALQDQSEVSNNTRFLIRTNKVLEDSKEKLEYYINTGFIEDTYDKVMYTYVWLRSEVELITKLLEKSLRLK